MDLQQSVETILTHCPKGFIQIGFTSRLFIQQTLTKDLLISRHCANLPSSEGKETINNLKSYFRRC